MRVPSEEVFLQALSFLPPELRAALAVAPDGSTCGALPERQVALLWCDISGFSRATNEFLATGADGVENLQREIRAHYALLLETIRARAGEPVTFVGDGLLSVWPDDGQGMAETVLRAIDAAKALVSLHGDGRLRFGLNHHVACGGIRTLELGGRHGRWLRASVGSALKELESIAQIKRPNEIVVTAEAAAYCPPDALSEPIGDRGARVFTGDERGHHYARSPLAVPPLDAWPAAVARLPRSAVGWIESVGLKYLADLRPVTSVNVALHEFDQTADGAAEWLDKIVQAIQDVVHSRDGYVADVFLDEKGASVLITFGTPPDAHSDDPLRGVLSAREILAVLLSMGVNCSIGVATGRVLCSCVGDADRLCYLVLGDALIRSTRLSQAIETGLLVDNNTMRATRDMVAFQDDPLLINFKGAPDPAPVWSLAADHAENTRPRRLAGRTREMSKLMDFWSHAVSGKAGRHIIIEAESGLGKTSLAKNLQYRIEAQGGRFLFATASAIEQDAPFSVLRHLVMETLGVSSIALAKTRRETLLERMPESLREHAPLLNALFPTGLEETSRTAALSGNARAERVQDLVVDLIAAQVKGQPTCLCLDDAQWLDSGTRQVLVRLANGSPHLMILILSQPLAEGSWRALAPDAGFELLRLGALSEEDLRDLIRLRLGCAEVDDALLSQIASRTECHPFFSAEVMKSLVDSESVVIRNGTAQLNAENPPDTQSLPDTLHGMVLQRLDRLQPEEQLSMRVASVAGLSFPTKLVCDIHPLQRASDEVSRQLVRQISNGFLLEQRAENMPGFAFTHGIVREVAHSQLPRTQRIGLHAQAAEWIEEHSGQDRSGKLLELAHHWIQAGRNVPAVTCLLEEAVRLFSQGFAVEAATIGFRAIALSGVEVPSGAEAFNEETQANMAVIEQLANGRQPTDLIVDIAAPDADLGLRLQALLSIAPFAFQSNQFETFAWASTEAMRLVLENSAGPPHAFSMYSIVKALLTGDRAAGAAWSRAALDLDAVTGGAALPAASFIDTWFHSHWRVPMRESIEINRVGAERALADNDPQYTSYNVAGGVILKAAMGHHLDEVIAHGAEALQHSLHRNSRMHVLLEVQFARALRQETKDGLSLSDDMIDEAEDIAWVTETEFANQIGFYLASRARLHRYAGDWDGAVTWSERADTLRPAIAGQIVEVDLVFHTLLARFGRILSGQRSAEDEAQHIEKGVSQLAEWRNIQQDNFAAKARIAELVRAGIAGDDGAAEGLLDLSQSFTPGEWLHDRALAAEYAARLKPDAERIAQAIRAYEDWGATGVAERLRRKGV